MGWAVGYDSKWSRDIGYGVPAICDHPGCSEHINRGLAYVCGSDPYGGEHGCGLYFCELHRTSLTRGDDFVELCWHCVAGDGLTYEPKPDTLEWLAHKLIDESWWQWREENPEWVERANRTLVQLS